VSDSDAVELSLAGATTSVPAARRFVRSTLQAWGLDGLVDTAMLVVSELATNAVLHARSTFTVRLSVDTAGRLRLEVVDGSVKQPLSRHAGTSAATGRGLAIVEGLVSNWGVEPVTGGKVVWVQLERCSTSRGSAGPSRLQGGRGRGARADPSGLQARAA
jgi:anti-sigma regulatory factor (Ser/Thr protein kinase)